MLRSGTSTLTEPAGPYECVLHSAPVTPLPQDCVRVKDLRIWDQKFHFHEGLILLERKHGHFLSVQELLPA